MNYFLYKLDDTINQVSHSNEPVICVSASQHSNCYVYTFFQLANVNKKKKKKKVTIGT